MSLKLRIGKCWAIIQGETDHEAVLIEDLPISRFGNRIILGYIYQPNALAAMGEFHRLHGDSMHGHRVYDVSSEPMLIDGYVHWKVTWEDKDAV